MLNLNQLETKIKKNGINLQNSGNESGMLRCNELFNKTYKKKINTRNLIHLVLSIVGIVMKVDLILYVLYSREQEI